MNMAIHAFHRGCGGAQKVCHPSKTRRNHTDSSLMPRLFQPLLFRLAKCTRNELIRHVEFLRQLVAVLDGSNACKLCRARSWGLYLRFTCMQHSLFRCNDRLGPDTRNCLQLHRPMRLFKPLSVHRECPTWFAYRPKSYECGRYPLIERSQLNAHNQISCGRMMLQSFQLSDMFDLYRRTEFARWAIAMRW